MDQFFSNFLVKWSQKLKNPYGKEPDRRAVVEQAVAQDVVAAGLDARGAKTIIIK